MNRLEKQEVAKNLAGLYEKYSCAIVTHYHGLSVDEISSLRADVREFGGVVQVAKNSLAKIAAQDSDAKEITQFLSGPSAIAFSEDPVSLAKALVSFKKDHDSFEITGGVLDGAAIDKSEISALSKLASLEEIRANIIGLLNAPATKIAGVLNAPATKLARVCSARAESGN